MLPVFKGKHAEIINDRTPERAIEGALSSGKTTAAIWAELEAFKQHPGIWTLMARWTDDATRTLLRPAFEQLARIHGTSMEWNRDENAFEIENGSRCFLFGLKTQSTKQEDRYGKIRGLPVSRILVDQAEQLPTDFAAELRFRLRPDIEAQMRKQTFPTQLTFIANAVDKNHWLADQFPITNKIAGRRYWSLSLYDNAHNLPAEMIEKAERDYPPTHPKHATMVLGQRGPSIIGDAIYEKLFSRQIHGSSVLAPRADAPILECYEYGEHSPCWVLSQRTPHGGLWLLGGMIGSNAARMVLEKFIPITAMKRAEWYPDAQFKTAAPPTGEKRSTTGSRYTLMRLLRENGIRSQWRESGNAPDVQLAMIESIASLLLRRSGPGQEALMVNADPSKWLEVAEDGTTSPNPFMSFAFEGGYVWSEHRISVNHKEVRQPKSDDWYSNAMRCVENTMLNFCAGQPSESERERKEAEHAKERQPYKPVSVWS